MISCRLLVTYLDRRPGLRLDSEAMGQHELAEEFVGSNQATATMNATAEMQWRSPLSVLRIPIPETFPKCASVERIDSHRLFNRSRDSEIFNHN